MKNFGGDWTEQKLQAFIEYVKAYLTILNKYKTIYHWETIYFDGFAGYGERINVNNQYQNIFELEYSDEEKQEISLYHGSVSRILNLPETFKFDWYYFIDTNEKYIDNLEKIKANIKLSNPNRIIIRKADCNAQLQELSGALKKNKYAAMILLDPFGMQVEWDSIAKLKNTRSDIWILIPSGMAINRLLDKKQNLKSINKLEFFFGLSKQEIENIFYKSYTDETLFGQVTSSKKIKYPIDKIVDIYIRQLSTIWKHVTKTPLILKNSKNCSIFHFLFASNNLKGLKIASEIIEKIQK